MLGIHFRQLYRTCDKVIIRNLRSRRLDTKNPNPGLDRQIKAFEAEGLRVKEENLEEFVEQSESDFYNVGEAYNEHHNETLIGKYELRHRIVKEKYFKENMPNLLTWSEKEQIRHLASSQPDEWTPEKIAESFPITEPVVKKLLKFPWKPATEQRIARHDASVMRNWKELKEGSLDIPPELRNHFLKFSNRTIPPLSQKSIKIDITPEQDLGEFEQIVRKCAAKESTNNTENQSTKLALPSPHSSKPQDKQFKEKKDPKLITLDELTSRIKNRLEKGNNVDINDKIIINSTQAPSQSITERVQAEMELFHETHKEKGIVEYKTKTEDPKEIMNYPERIRIPKKAYKKGATYKVNDCYYDHDGKFLYRVLGMSQ
ncbi:hypothetical protein PYW07_002829 [Mythimna separata]|uniref:Neugrin n=1 Tax=Mythimna separata TaxID=271217 RepID=A0AAD7YHJ2_MYTSE|nr:hypothetical protein PYW07_002829 [Mythimna separata]